MPASAPPMSAVGIKWVSAYPGNASSGLPQVSGLMIMNDIASGIARAVLDSSVITVARAAVASVLAARFLARPDSDTLGIALEDVVVAKEVVDRARSCGGGMVLPR